MPLTAGRWEHLEGSRIGEAYEHALRLKAEGRDILDLTTGEPDFATPEHIVEAAHQAIDRGETKYTPTDGTAELKAAVRSKLLRDNGLDYAAEEICIGAGAKPLLYYVMLALLDPGDEVIVPTPAWASFPGMVALAGGQAKLVECPRASGYKLGADALRDAMGDRTRALVLNTPSNPTGAVYDERELGALEAVLAAHERVVVVADEIYEHLVYDRPFASVAAAMPRLRERIVCVNGVSKGYAMTGWRIGYAAGPLEVMTVVRKLLSHSAGNPATPSQRAAIEALTGPQELVAERTAHYRRRRDRAVSALNQAPWLGVDPPDGAFYLYVDCSALVGRRTPAGERLGSAEDFCRHLLDAAGVATVPGAGFYAEGGLRLSYACDDTTLDEACRRIVRVCNSLE